MRYKILKQYLRLEQIFREISILESNIAILDWDKEVYMPVKAIGERGEQISLVSKIIYEKLSSKYTKSLCNDVDIKELNNWQLQNFRLIQKKIKINSAMPSQLITDLAICSTKTAIIWRKAKKENNFNLVKSELKILLQHIRDFAKIKADIIGTKPYEALIDEYEPGLKVEFIDELMNSVQNFTTPIIQNITLKTPTSIISEYPIDEQKRLINFILTDLGFDFGNGRIDSSSHPFCGGSSSDIRLTTNYNYHDFTQSLYGAIHEAGHANYNRNLPKKWQYQPIGRSLSSGIHESQSLIYENQVARNFSFIKFLFPYLKKLFGYKISFDDKFLYNHINFIQPSLIRVDADEITYHTHVLIRYKIEKSLINNEIEVGEVPEIWNKSYKDMLGITPKNDTEGCLQDIHWFSGSFGYFPTYTIGALIAAQIMHHANINIQNLDKKIELGQFTEFNEFLNKTIHNNGSLFPNANSLINYSLKEQIDVKYFKEYINKKYSF